jgi:hypothetical protein
MTTATLTTWALVPLVVLGMYFGLAAAVERSGLMILFVVVLFGSIVLWVIHTHLAVIVLLLLQVIVLVFLLRNSL